MTNMFILIGTTITFYIAIILLACFTLKKGYALGWLICLSTAATVFVCFYGLKIEADTGYYECNKSHNRYVPTNYFSVMFAPHMNTTRYLKCPKCGKRSWQKKALTK